MTAVMILDTLLCLCYMKFSSRKTNLWILYLDFFVLSSVLVLCIFGFENGLAKKIW